MSEALHARAVAQIVEGARLHYEQGSSSDPDLDLLLGDESYASGLRGLAKIGDIGEIVRLAELIATVARAYAEGDAELGARLLGEAEQGVGKRG